MIIRQRKVYDMLDKLQDLHIVTIEKTNDGYKIGEACDWHYSVTLTQEQFEQLIRELQTLASRSKPA